MASHILYEDDSRRSNLAKTSSNYEDCFAIHVGIFSIAVFVYSYVNDETTAQQFTMDVEEKPLLVICVICFVLKIPDFFLIESSTSGKDSIRQAPGSIERGQSTNYSTQRDRQTETLTDTVDR